MQTSSVNPLLFSPPLIFHMPNYRYLEHTSDLYIEGSGASPGEAIESVAQGLFDSINVSVSGSVHEIEITESGSDTEDMIINLFTRVLAEMDAEGRQGIWLSVKNIDIESNKVQAVLRTSEGKAKLHVKAVTFHGFELLAQDGKTTLRILFDI